LRSFSLVDAAVGDDLFGCAELGLFRHAAAAAAAAGGEGGGCLSLSVPSDLPSDLPKNGSGDGGPGDPREGEGGERDLEASLMRVRSKFL
jgi:hypothetical protein